MGSYFWLTNFALLFGTDENWRKCTYHGYQARREKSSSWIFSCCLPTSTTFHTSFLCRIFIMGVTKSTRICTRNPKVELTYKENLKQTSVWTTSKTQTSNTEQHSRHFCNCNHPQNFETSMQQDCEGWVCFAVHIIFVGWFTINRSFRHCKENARLFMESMLCKGTVTYRLEDAVVQKQNGQKKNALMTQERSLPRGSAGKTRCLETHCGLEMSPMSKKPQMSMTGSTVLSTCSKSWSLESFTEMRLVQNPCLLFQRYRISVSEDRILLSVRVWWRKDADITLVVSTL